MLLLGIYQKPDSQYDFSLFHQCILRKILQKFPFAEIVTSTSKKVGSGVNLTFNSLYWVDDAPLITFKLLWFAYPIFATYFDS